MRMGCRRERVVAAVMLLGLIVSTGSGQQPVVSLYDTGASPVESMTGDMLAAKSGWQTIAADQKPASFKGASVVANNTLAVVARKGAKTLDVYVKGKTQWMRRAGFVPVVEAGDTTIDSVKTLANGGDGVELEVVCKGGGRISVSVEPGKQIVQTKPLAGATGIRLSAPSRFGVLPDFFADDLVLDARTLPAGKSEVPSENIFLMLQGHGDSIVAAIWDKADKDVEFAVSGEGDGRLISDLIVTYGKGGKIWIGMLDEPGIWATEDTPAGSAGKVFDLKWTPPFNGKWKSNLMTENGVGESWVINYGPVARWATAIGQYDHPCWFTPKDGAQITHIKNKYARDVPAFAGPIVIYPSDRNAKSADSKTDISTPADKFTVVDLMRNSMGVGPCENILDVVGQGATDKGLYTCAMYERFEIFDKLGDFKDERVLIEQTVRDTQTFVKAIRDRIESYVQFEKDLLKYLDEQKKAHPEQTAFIEKMEKNAKAIEDRYNRRKGIISTPEQAKKIMDTYASEILSDTPSQSWESFAGWVRDNVGFNQDELVAECRMAVKVLRQSAALEAAKDPKVGDIANEIRKRTHEILRNKLGHEASARG